MERVSGVAQAATGLTAGEVADQRAEVFTEALAGVQERRVLLGVDRGGDGESVQAPGRTERPTAGPGNVHWDKQQLEIHSSGVISELFGPLFEAQDARAIQCRMPEPPLLLADRVTGIDATPGQLGTGTIWTETDVVAGAFEVELTAPERPGAPWVLDVTAP